MPRHTQKKQQKQQQKQQKKGGDLKGGDLLEKCIEQDCKDKKDDDLQQCKQNCERKTTPEAPPSDPIEGGKKGGKNVMAYCVKCKGKRSMKNATLKKTKNNRKMMKGVCPKCGTKMNKFVA